MAEKAEKDGEQDGQKRQGEVGADAVQTKTQTAWVLDQRYVELVQPLQPTRQTTNHAMILSSGRDS